MIWGKRGCNVSTVIIRTGNRSVGLIEITRLRGICNQTEIGQPVLRFGRVTHDLTLKIHANTICMEIFFMLYMKSLRDLQDILITFTLNI